ncbi:MAG TPA: flagellar filament capping protein FliD, partial [Limnochordales bacterium]|nr:flagellar filament capping protein FliD [Limnochordales bacterium]
MSMYISGIASGLDTDAWIEAVMALERRPITQLQQRKNALQQQKDAWRDINSRLNNLSSRLSDLRLSSTFLNRTAASSNTDVLTVSAGTGAIPGHYEITIEQLAQAHRVRSDQFEPDAAVGVGGTIKINGVEIDIDAKDTIADVARKINEKDSKVLATVVDGHLVLTAAETNQKIEFEKSDVLVELGILDDNGQDGDPVPKHELQSPQEAVIWVDGIRVTRDSNTISDVIQGVTLTLKETGTVTVEVRHDVNRVVDRVRAFVDQYNSVQSFISDKTSRGQILQGDVLLSRIQMELRQLTMAPVLGSDGLAMIGITIDRHGTMSLDEAKLRAVLEEDPEAVHRLFAATQEEDGFDGVAVRLGQRLEQWLRSNEGLLASRQQLFDDRMKDIDRSIERLEARLELREQTLRRQFIALEEVLSAFQTQAMWLEG